MVDVDTTLVQGSDPTRRGRVSDAGREKGYVLIVVLLLLMAVTATGHGLLVLSRSELSVSRARWAALARRLAAEGGVHIASRGISAVRSLPAGEWAPTGEGRIPPRARFVTRALRLSPEIVLLRSEGVLDRLPGAHRAIRLYWGMSPEARVGAALGIVESGGTVTLTSGSRIDVARVLRAPPPWSEDRCAGYRPGLDTLFTGGVAPWAELVENLPKSHPGPSSRSGEVELPSLGFLDHEALMAGADLSVAGLVSPSPRGIPGGCDQTSTLNWGAPLNPLDPCASYRPVVASEGSLVIEGGGGQGVLLVAGDATLSAGARYFGVVIVAGDLLIQSGAEISGLLRVRGSVTLSGGSEIVGSACAALAALEAAESLHGLIPLPEGAWLEDPG